MAKAMALLAAMALAGDVNVGDPAPAFEAKDHEGNLWKSADHVGKKVVVVFFYPAAFTGG